MITSTSHLSVSQATYKDPAAFIKYGSAAKTRPCCTLLGIQYVNFLKGVVLIQGEKLQK